MNKQRDANCLLSCKNGVHAEKGRRQATLKPMNWDEEGGGCFALHCNDISGSESISPPYTFES